MLVAAVGSLFSVPALNSAPVSPQHCVTITRTLALHSTGSDVVKLQQFLGVLTTGYFGPITRNALIEWQLHMHVVTSEKTVGAGITGPLTRAALRCATAAASTPQSTSTSARAASIQTPTTTASTTVQPKPVPAIVPVVDPAAGSRSGGYSASTYSCPAFTTPKPPVSQCATGEWVLVNDEADCPALWDCQDPNALE